MRSLFIILSGILGNLTIAPIKEVFEVGDTLKCLADGDPIPNYEWIWLQTGQLIDGSVLTIDDNMTPDRNHICQCTAYNTVAGFRKQISTIITFTVAGSNSYEPFYLHFKIKERVENLA